MSVATQTGGLGRAGIVTFGGALFSAGMTFLATGFISNELGTAGTGLFFQATALFVIAANILQLGADTTLVRTMSRALALDRQRILIPTAVVAIVPVAVVSIIAASLLAWAGPSVAAVLAPTNTESMTPVYIALAAFLPATALLAVALGGSRGLGNVVAYTSLQNVALPLLRVSLVATVLMVWPGLEPAIISWIAPSVPLMLVALIVFAVLLRRHREREGGGSIVASDWSRTSIRDIARAFWSFSLPRGGATALERAIDWSDVLIVIALRGVAEGGIYAVVTRCVAVGGLLETAARIVTGPQISRALALEDLDAARLLFRRVTRTLVAISWPFYLLLAVFAPVVLGFFGDGFEEGATAMRILCAAMMLSTAAGMVQSVLLMGGRSHWQLANRAVQLLILTLVALVLVPGLGIVGAALAWAASIVVDTSLAAFQVGRRMKIVTSPRSIGVPAIVAVIIFGAGGVLVQLVFGSSPLTLAMATAVLGAIYIGTGLIFRDRLGLTDLIRRRS